MKALYKCKEHNEILIDTTVYTFLHSYIHLFLFEGKGGEWVLLKAKNSYTIKIFTLIRYMNI